VIERQAEAWNRGDLDGFMATYWQSDSMTFQAAGTRLHGWDTLARRYRKNYPPERRGKLNFSDIEIQQLSPDAVLLLGRYHLAYSEAEEAEGVFTLVMKRFPEGWLIIHDHSSAAPAQKRP
jgi:beta-aspartyl-peptidase (threonine type)